VFALWIKWVNRCGHCQATGRQPQVGGFVANYLTACLLLYVCRASGGAQRVVSIDVEPIVWVDVEVVWSNRAGFKNGKARDASAH
jgi:hypothetical protein